MAARRALVVAQTLYGVLPPPIHTLSISNNHIQQTRPESNNNNNKADPRRDREVCHCRREDLSLRQRAPRNERRAGTFRRNVKTLELRAHRFSLNEAASFFWDVSVVEHKKVRNKFFELILIYCCLIYCLFFDLICSNDGVAYFILFILEMINFNKKNTINFIKPD